jgi:hypothetical protein
MTRLDAFRNKVPDYPEDIFEIRKACPELAAFKDAEIETLYRDFSDWAYCAGWMMLSAIDLKEFRDWLNSDIDYKDLSWP